MSLDAITNFGYATLSAGIDSDDTSITLTTGHGARLPSTAFNAPIWDTSYGSPTLAYHAGAAEIVRVTARSTDTLTITRAQEGTTARSFNTSGRTYAIGVTLTKAAYDQLAPKDTPVFTGTVTAPGALIAAGTAMTGEEINVALRDNLYSATGNVTWTHSATPAVGQIYGVTVTTDGTAREITLPVTAFSPARGANINTVTFPANATHTVYVKRTATGYQILGDPLTALQIAELIGLADVATSGDAADLTGTIDPDVVATGSALQVVRRNAGNTAFECVDAGSGLGDVVAASNFGTDNRIIRSDGTTKGVQSSGVEIDDSGNLNVLGDGVQGSLALSDAHATTPKTIRLTVPATVTDNYNLVFPATIPTAGQVMRVASVAGEVVTLEHVTPLVSGGALGTPSSGNVTNCVAFLAPGFAGSDETTALTTGEKVSFRMPWTMTVTSVFACVKTAPTGAAIVFDVENGGSSILSTLGQIEASEFATNTSATPPVVSGGSQTLTLGDLITIDLDQVGSTVAGTGFKIWLIGTK